MPGAQDSTTGSPPSLMHPSALLLGQTFYGIFLLNPPKSPTQRPHHPEVRGPEHSLDPVAFKSWRA